mmetsp:Transcript_909/g.1430  ORF Transcript_909/g.1430 Transcript_909/m.1430 type:complete len:324 (+) Transcript_909:46-1017(+)|eukprot:CAMPEP_0117425192 /NCGR_PEP_ID=MMETSP0758-20121206/5500_1 /TAXON_ID=63605 /ORGANISM="Percolomonas cosmopolitus, Strain AE-1 (ATCC 50343)" /LENGTH=323 /DNA_ID=CAMNT_0005209503 /DNA_START=33 /DNA_END=1004 /DNA_ORIENTATION=+
MDKMEDDQAFIPDSEGQEKEEEFVPDSEGKQDGEDGEAFVPDSEEQMEEEIYDPDPEEFQEDMESNATVDEEDEEDTAPPKKKIKKTPKSPRSPKKEKKKKSRSKLIKVKISTKEAAKLLLSFMEENNRPFSIAQLHNNHQTLMGAALCKKAATQLQKEKKITSYRKKTIYYLNQEGREVFSPEQMKEHEEEIKKLEALIDEEEKMVKKLEAKVARVTNEPTNTELQEYLVKLQQEIDEKNAAINKLDDQSNITPEQLEKLKEQLSNYLKIWSKYKRYNKDVIGMFADGLQKKDSDLEELIQIEKDDEVAGPSYQEIYDLANV